MPPTSQITKQQQTPLAPTARSRRPDIANSRLLAACVTVPAVLIGYFLLLPALPSSMRVAGSPAVYLLGVAGTALLLVAAIFVLVKRTNSGGSPVTWFMAHVACGTIGFVLVAIHTTGKIDRAPALLLLNLAALMALGVWARVSASRTMADTFGTKLKGFATPDASKRAALKHIIEKKTALLARLDPAAFEATFSVTLAHLMRKPVDAISYMRLARDENRLTGARSSVARGQAWWRPLHLILAGTFVGGLLIHVILVTFFAGYVAGGGPINWWHVTAWNF